MTVDRGARWSHLAGEAFVPGSESRVLVIQVTKTLSLRSLVRQTFTMKQLGWLDALFLRVETPEAPMLLNLVQIYDPSTAPGGSVTFKGILAEIEARLHLTPTFRRKLMNMPLGLSTPWWIEDEDFDLEYHVRHIALPAPGDWRQFCIQIARLHSRGLDMTRPPWEMVVIEGLDNIAGVPRGSFAISLKIHHAAIDGMAGVEMLTALHDHSPDAAPPAPPEREWKGERAPGTAELVGRTAVSSVVHPIRAVRVLGGHSPRAARAIVSRVRSRQFSPDTVTVPRTRFQDAVTPHRVFDARFFDFNQFKQIKMVVPKATVNDVALALLGGALRHYLDHHGELPADSLICGCPVSLRLPDEAKAGGNAITLMRVSLHSDIEDALVRLREITATMSRQRELKDAVSASALIEVAELLPGALIGLGSRALTRLPGRGPSVVNVSLTNVPGARTPLYFAGAKAILCTGNAPIFSGVGLMHIVTTYEGTLSYSFTSDRTMMPDPQFYADCIQRSFDELLTAARKVGAPAEAPNRSVVATPRKKAANARRTAGQA